MKIVVISDTHGNYPAAVRACDAQQEYDAVVHLGDLCDDAAVLEEVLCRPVISVSGNCDFAPRVPRELMTEFAGLPFLICHGDRYGVKAGLARLARRAASRGARVALFGHTHLPLVEEQEGVLLVNPGALATATAEPTCAVLTLVGGNVRVEIVAVPPPPRV